MCSNRTIVDGFVAISLFIILVISRATSNMHQYTVMAMIKFCVLGRVFAFPRNVLVTKFFTEFRHQHRFAFSIAFRGAGHFTFMLLVLGILFVHSYNILNDI